MNKTGKLWKLGEGPINFDWNQRYFVIDDRKQELVYYKHEGNDKSRGCINLVDAMISNITTMKDKDFAFSIHTYPPYGKVYYLSADKLEEAVEWRN